MDAMTASSKDMNSKDSGDETKKSTGMIIRKSRRLQGMKMRDEFLCPITYELLREPVVALDGHTYEKSAIEKWLKSNHTSPRSGEIMEDSIIPNTNLKKLIQDMINEGGAGLYTNDVCDSERLFDVFAEKVLILKCVGPPESDWNMQSFQVTHLGCVGGRKTQHEDPSSTSHQKDCMLFRDTTVSRRHFEITAVHDKPGKYAIQDLGSAGGTFIRIQAGQRKRLHAGMMLLLGKHQFIISSIDDSGTAEPPGAHSPGNSVRGEALSKTKTKRGSCNLIGGGSSALEELVSQSEQVVADLSTSETKDENEFELEKRLRELNDWLSFHISPSPSVEKFDEEAKDERNHSSRGRGRGNTAHRGGRGPGGTGGESKAGPVREVGYESDLDSLGATHDVLKGKGAGPKGTEGHAFTGKRCTITCFNPDGSPLQGKSFVVGCQGASLGRKPTNDIVLSLSIPNDSGQGDDDRESVVNIDTAISSDHARIEMDHTTGCFFIIDGTVLKPSLNGTWFRLSGPHQNSPLFPIEPKMELLIGVLRFSVSESMTISEKLVESNGTSKVPDDDAKDCKSVGDNTHVEHLGGTVSCTGHSSRHSGNSASTVSVTRKNTISAAVPGKRSDPPASYK